MKHPDPFFRYHQKRGVAIAFARLMIANGESPIIAYQVTAGRYGRTYKEIQEGVEGRKAGQGSGGMRRAA